MLLHPDERQALLEEYRVLIKGIFEQGNAVWLVNSVLIASSVLAMAQASIYNDKLDAIVFGVLTLLSVVFVLFSLLFYTLTERVTSIRWARVNEIECILEIKGNRYIHSQVKKKWWYALRTKMWYALYLLLLVLLAILYLAPSIQSLGV